MRAWQGLGYNRRALRLHETARAIVERYDGRFPSDPALLRELPGIGEYTAGAIACFVFGLDVPVVDVNVVRVVSRLLFKCHTPMQGMPEGTVVRVLRAITPVADSYRWHQALMDLGSTICTARRPACHACPLAGECLSAYPLEVELFDGSRATRPEPSLRGEPRRLWRGRIIEILRGEHEPISIGEMIDRLLPVEILEGAEGSDRRAMLTIMESLYGEGMIERAGSVREGGLSELDRVALPEH